MTNSSLVTEALKGMTDEQRREIISRFNGYSGAADIDVNLRQEIERRERVLSPTYNLFYNKPIEVVSGRGAHLYDSDGTDYLDMYNNIPSVGHGNERVARAVYEQMLKLNTHTRYLYTSLTDYAERLLGTMPDAIDRIFLTNSGSEANDLAIRVARSTTGHRGVIVTRAAYHGSTGFSDAISPISRVFSQGGDPAWLRTVAAPDLLREGDKASARFIADVDAAIKDLDGSGFGVAAFVADMILSTDGVIPFPTDYFSTVQDHIHTAGGLFLADEVQAGFGRLGQSMWGFQRHSLVPDLVSMGKPMGNGYPMAGLAAKHELLNEFAKQTSYFSTFGGSPVAVAAGTAVLDEIRDKDLIARSDRMGRRLMKGLEEIRDLDPAIGEIRGSGLFVAVEYVTDHETNNPNPLRALEVVARHRDHNILISNTGWANSALKIRPPMVITDEDIDRFLEVFASIAREH